MSSVHLVLPDPHAHPDHHNDRALWIGELIHDLKPDVVINLGDTADMPSLASYDKGKKSFQGRTYARDIAAHGDFQEKLWHRTKKAKKKQPRKVTLIGNHEQRIERAIQIQPELEGTVGYRDLSLSKFYDEVVDYDGGTPGTIGIDGVTYAHYFISGVMGRPVGGEHPAYTMLSKLYTSCTQGHTHTFDYSVRGRRDGTKVMGLVAGVGQDYHSLWAGDANRLWSRGVVIKHGVDNGQYDLEWISMERLKEVYELPR
jgi:hypothetical protein